MLYPSVHNEDASMTIIKFFTIVVLVHILIFGYTKFHQHDVYCTPSTKKLSTALFYYVYRHNLFVESDITLWYNSQKCFNH